jgi:putative transposase
VIFDYNTIMRWVNTYALIALEGLAIQHMQGNARLAKSIGDAAWDQLRDFVTYKAAWAGRHVVMVDPRNTTKRCSRCGALSDKLLSERTHQCPRCGLTLDHDLNAAINILAVGLHSRGVIPQEAAGLSARAE